MKKILGLDIGTASIGWSYLWLDGENSQMKAGVRVIPIDSDQTDAFTKGQPVTINTERRRYRGMRKNLDRYQLRRENLIEFFLKEGWASNRGELLAASSNDEVFLNRSRGVTQRIDLLAFARVILRLNKNRGFKSNRLADRGNEDSTEYKKAISLRDAELQERNLTIGQVFWLERQAWLESPSSVPEPHFESRTYSRASVVSEFEALWNQQSQHYAELTEAKRVEVRDRLLFFQRPLKSAKHLVGRCPLVPSRRVAPKSSPIFQEFRIWHDVKNLRIVDAEGVARPLSYEQQLHIVQHSAGQKSWTEAAIARKLLGYDRFHKANMPLTSNQFVFRVSEVFEESRRDFGEIVEMLNVDVSLGGDAFDKQPVMRLWHLLYATEDEDALAEALRTKFPFLLESEIQGLIQVRLPDDYGNLSHKAMRQILPFLRSEECKSYADAATLAGYNHSHSESKEQLEARQLLDLLPEVKRNSLRNPVVEKVRNQVVNLVNEILTSPEFGRPDAIHVELARELKQPAKKRKQVERRNRDNESDRSRVRKELEQLGIGRKISRRDILRYQLAEECGWVSVYTGNPIEISRLFNTQDYEIEHIIPQSRVFDDSFLNKTIAERSVNLEKGNMTAMEYMRTRGTVAVREYEDRLKRHLDRKDKAMSLSKVQKLRWLGEDIPSDFINRQLNETQYIAREAYNRMKLICKDVVPMAGQVTAYLRHQWGIEGILEELTLPAYREAQLTEIIHIAHPDGRTESKEIPKEWSKRTDHRHHAMDAIAVALTTRSHIQFLNSLNHRFGDNGERLDDLVNHYGSKSARLAPSCGLEIVRTLSKQALECLLVSRKPGKRSVVTSTYRIKTKAGEISQKHKIPRGQLHKETVYGCIKRYLPNPIPLARIPDDLTLVVDRREREAIEERLAQSDLPPKKLFSAARLKKWPLTIDGIELKAVRCFEKIFTQKVQVGPGLKVDKVIDSAVRELLQQRLARFENKPNLAFSNLDEDPIWLDAGRTKQLRKVTIEVNNNALVPLRESENGPKDYVNLRNNHHLALYKDEDSGVVVPRIVSFMEVVQRNRLAAPAVRGIDEEGRELISTLAGDEYVLFDVNFDNEEDVLAAHSKEIAPHLFRVQKMSYANVSKQSGLDLYFRHHAQATLKWDNPHSFRRVTSIPNLPLWKVRLNVLGVVVAASRIIE